MPDVSEYVAWLIPLLERFQTLATGILAVAAAVWASRPVYKQLREMARQSAAAAVPNLRVIAAEIEEEMVALKTADRQIAGFSACLEDYDRGDFERTYTSLPATLHKIAGEAFTAWQFLSTRADRDPDDVLDASRKKGIAALRTAVDAGYAVATAVRLQTTGPDYENGEDDIEAEEADGRGERLRAAQAEWVSWYNGYISLLLEARRKAWRDVRRMEGVAKGTA